VASGALVLRPVLLVGAFDYLVFANIDKLAKRLNPTSLFISEVAFGSSSPVEHSEATIPVCAPAIPMRCGTGQ
jgi:hypothetical protein